MNLNCSYKIVLVALLAAQSFWAAAQTNNPAAPLDYSTFTTFIAQRNIFDPDRVPNVPWTAPRPRPVYTAPVVQKPDSFSLVGIIGYGEGNLAGAYAFFDGSSMQYRKTTKLNGDIANFKVADIAADSVTLVSGTNKMVLGIGEQLHDGGGGNWLFSNGTAVRYNTASSGFGKGRNSGRNGFGNGGDRRRNNNNFGGGNNGNFNGGNNGYGNGNGGNNNGGFNRRNNYQQSGAAPDNSQTPDMNAPIIVIPGRMAPDDSSAPDPDPQNN